ncbi:hypothetical protein WSK_3255 [Novosphingobium sp. Rr 2-17]|nr:hypothetical protein WSK_3255 [Novosphingobium sp. Rr 2-17]
MRLIIKNTKILSIIAIVATCVAGYGDAQAQTRVRKANHSGSFCKYGTAENYPDGGVKSCVIVSIGSTTLSVYSPIGKYGSSMVGCQPGSSVTFHEHGGVQSCVLSSNVTLASEKPGGVVGCKAYSQVYIDENGYSDC